MNYTQKALQDFTDSLTKKDLDEMLGKDWTNDIDTLQAIAEKTCEHKNTIVCGCEDAYYIQCKDCPAQWDEAGWTDMKENV
jgi:hypothetical protein